MLKRFKIDKNEDYIEVIRQYVFKHINGKSITQSEDLVIVLKVHLLFEILMDEILSTFVTDDLFYNEIKLTFSEKIRILSKRKLLHEDLLEVLREVNRIRNDFAHDIETSLDSIDFSKFVTLCYDKSSVPNQKLIDDVRAHKKVLFASCSVHFLAGITSFAKQFKKV